MKKIMALFLGLSMLFSLSACTKKDDDKDGTSSASSSPSLETTNPADAQKRDYDSLKNNKVGWGMGHDLDDNKIPVASKNANDSYSQYDAYFVGAEDKIIYLTFDQGYENGYTEKILDTLKEKNVPATFFLTYDYINEAEDLITRMIAEGHTLGNHSTKHKSFPSLTVSEALNDIDTLHKTVQEKFGYNCTTFRFPMGEYSERMLAVVQDYGYKSLFWSFAYQDWLTDSQPDKESSLQKLKDRLHPGAIYLLHSVSSTNAAILGDFIDYAQSEGYEFVVY